ncbi:hypothetical protein HK405_013853 [Cladochytrium tenue]|nr:hypothetical protein HK405_013853 [Cladochytrium tenue]
MDDIDDALVGLPRSSGVAPQQLDAAVRARAADVRNLLFRGSLAQAISTAIHDPPFGEDPQPIKDMNTGVVMEALSAAKAADMAQVVKQLSQPELDTLMKFIYRGMASPELYNSAVLLAWHEKVVEAAGLACIVRVLTDRQPL